MFRTFRALGFITLFILVSVSALSIDLRDIRDGGPPIITEKSVIFRYKPAGKIPEYVYVSGDFNNWDKPLRMYRNMHNVFVYEYKDIGKMGIVLKKGMYRYRYMVDGLWIKDPDNNSFVVDEYGVKLSTFKIQKTIIVVRANPIHIRDNLYIFYYKDEKARSVSLVGDFNFWNPYSHPMHKNESGLWEVVIDIPPGEYAYRFLVDGIYRTDPFGTSLVYDRFAKEMSLVKITGKENKYQ